jgi:hypothetical protein
VLGPAVLVSVGTANEAIERQTTAASERVLQREFCWECTVYWSIGKDLAACERRTGSAIIPRQNTVLRVDVVRLLLLLVRVYPVGKPAGQPDRGASTVRKDDQSGLGASRACKPGVWTCQRDRGGARTPNLDKLARGHARSQPDTDRGNKHP